MATFVLPKFGTVDASFLGFTIESASHYTIIKEASVGPTLLGNAAVESWEYKLTVDGIPEFPDILMQQQIVD